MCILEYATMLSKQGYDVWFMLVVNGDVSATDIDLTQAYWGGRFLRYDCPTLQTYWRKILARISSKCTHQVDFYFPWSLNRFINDCQRRHNFDGMIVNYIWLSKASMTDIPTKAIFTHDVFAYRREKISGYAWRSFSVAEEAKAIRRFSNILAIQDNESTYYSYLAPRSRIATVYSSFNYVEQPLTHTKNILFFSGGGNLNISAIKAFWTNVWPLVIAAEPQAQLLIGGKISDCLTKAELPVQVSAMGRYDNPADFYALGDIAINPITEGTGLKIKTMEAIAYGKVTIVTPHSADGIYDKANAPIAIANTDTEFANLIIANLRNLNRQDNRNYIQSLNQYISNQYSSIFK
jgi:hypothetical protein